MHTEDIFESEMGRMVTVRVKMTDYSSEENRHASLRGPQPQDGKMCVIAGNRTATIKVPKAVAEAAARVARDPNRSTMRVKVTPR